MDLRSFEQDRFLLDTLADRRDALPPQPSPLGRLFGRLRRS